MINNNKLRTGKLSIKEVFEKLHKWGVKFAKDRNLREEDLQATIKRIRKD